VQTGEKLLQSARMLFLKTHTFELRFEELRSNNKEGGDL